MTNNIVLGQTASLQREVTENLIKTFAQVSTDTNPLHLDAAFAQRSRFGRTIAHGMLLGSWISALLGSSLPGPGTVYLSQTLKFTAPVFVGDTITTQVTVIETKTTSKGHIVTLEARCSNQSGAAVLMGEAVVLCENHVS